MKTIEIVISSTGESRIETKGFVGGECREASRLLEAALGAATSETLTAEFHETPVQQQNHTQQEGGG